MCGIAGALVPGVPEGSLDATVGRMVDALWRRGPDDRGQWTEDHVSLGMRRLSIIDVCGGHQPIFSEDRSSVIVCNGEIYNYQELRRELEQRGHHFSTYSDVEVALHLYEESGPAMLSRLRGMFALAIWDMPQRRLLVARDRLGIKPLFYVSKPGVFAFGSELKALRQSPWCDERIDMEALDRYLTFGYIPAPHTIYEGVRKLLPGHYALVTETATFVERYWSLPAPAPVSMTTAEAMTQVDRLLGDAVRSHLMSDVPLGAFLSGGIDSSVVVAMMAEATDQPVRTFTIGFGGTSAGVLDERSYARATSERYGTAHVEYEVAPNVADVLDEAVDAFDEPFADDSIVPSYYVCQLARRNVTVALSGLGGDELFAGYERHLGIALSERLERLSPAVARRAVAAIVNRLPERADGHYTVNHMKRFVRGWDLQPRSRYVSYHTVFSRDAKAQLLGTSSPPPFDGNEAGTVPDLLAWALQYDIEHYLPDDILALSDRLSMWHGLELRVPFLDHPFVEFCQTVPSRLKIHGLTKKYVLREVAARRVPASVLNHRKQGFASPMASWLRGDLKAYVDSALAPDKLALHGLFRQGYVEELRHKHARREEACEKQIFTLLMFQRWFERCVLRKAERIPAMPSQTR